MAGCYLDYLVRVVPGLWVGFESPRPIGKGRLRHGLHFIPCLGIVFTSKLEDTAAAWQSAERRAFQVEEAPHLETNSAVVVLVDLCFVVIRCHFQHPLGI